MFGDSNAQLPGTWEAEGFYQTHTKCRALDRFGKTFPLSSSEGGEIKGQSHPTSFKKNEVG